MSGYERTLDVKNLSRSDVRASVKRLRGEAGVKTTKDIKTQHTRTPSVQGNWHPFLFPHAAPKAN